MRYWLRINGKNCSKTAVRIVAYGHKQQKWHCYRGLCCLECTLHSYILTFLHHEECFCDPSIFQYVSESGQWRSESESEQRRDTKGLCSLGSPLWIPSNPVNSRPLKESAACLGDSLWCVSIVTQHFFPCARISGWLMMGGGAHNVPLRHCVRGR